MPRTSCTWIKATYTLAYQRATRARCAQPVRVINRPAPKFIFSAQFNFNLQFMLFPLQSRLNTVFRRSSTHYFVTQSDEGLPPGSCARGEKDAHPIRPRTHALCLAADSFPSIHAHAAHSNKALMGRQFIVSTPLYAVLHRHDAYIASTHCPSSLHAPVHPRSRPSTTTPLATSAAFNSSSPRTMCTSASRSLYPYRLSSIGTSCSALITPSTTRAA